MLLLDTVAIPFLGLAELLRRTCGVLFVLRRPRLKLIRPTTIRVRVRGRTVLFTMLNVSYGDLLPAVKFGTTARKGCPVGVHLPGRFVSSVNRLLWPRSTKLSFGGATFEFTL